MAILAAAELEPDELDDFIATVAEAAGTGKKTVKDRIKKEQREREQNARKTAMASVEDGRVTLARPPSDGELLPMTKLLDELLASDEGEEPPMRDASGNLVEVRVQGSSTL